MFLGNLREMLHLKSFFNHSDLQIKRIKKHEADVKLLVEMLETSWIDPFSFEIQDLVCLSTGKAVPSDVEKDLLDAKDKGEAAFKQFSMKRIEKHEEKFHIKMTNLKPKTFSSLNAKKTFNK